MKLFEMGNKYFQMYLALIYLLFGFVLVLSFTLFFIEPEVSISVVLIFILNISIVITILWVIPLVFIFSIRFFISALKGKLPELSLNTTKQSPPFLLVLIIVLLLAILSLGFFRYHISSAGKIAYKIDSFTGRVWLVTPRELKEIK